MSEVDESDPVHVTFMERQCSAQLYRVAFMLMIRVSYISARTMFIKLDSGSLQIPNITVVSSSRHLESELAKRILLRTI